MRHGYKEGETDALHKSQTPAVFGVSQGSAREVNESPTLAAGEGPNRHGTGAWSTTQLTALIGSGDSSDRCALDPRPDGPRYAACGDAVTVNVAYWIGTRLAQ